MKGGNIGKQVVLGRMRELGEHCCRLWPCELGSPERQAGPERDQTEKREARTNLSVQGL